MKLNFASAIRISNQLNTTQSAISRSLQRLSSGKRVNSPKDDIAAYSEISELTAQIRGYNQGTRNANDAIGALNTAQAGITTQIDIVQRMREIAVQASNGSLTTADRNGLNSELQQILAEYTRIAQDTEYNGTKMLDGTFGTKTLQVGAKTLQTQDISVANVTANSEFLKTAGTGTFNARTTMTTGTGPTQVVVEDFNGDGKQDFVTADANTTGGATISVFLGKGDGTVLTRITFSMPSETVSVSIGMASGDFNNDGTKDLVITDNANAVASIYLGNGDGNFKPRTTVTTGAGVNGVTVGDFNRDGKLDFVTVDGTDATVSTLLGNGDGTFLTRQTQTTGTLPYDVKAGDMNGDGLLDLVVTDNGTNAGTTVSILLGNGNGTFQTRTTQTSGTGPRGLELADLDNDGDLDVVTANTGALAGTTLSVMLNNGVGILGSKTDTTVGTAPIRVRVGDMNGDGILDLVSSNHGSTFLSIALGNGNGTFATSTTFGANSSGTGPTGGSDLRLADLNGDGVLDVVEAEYNNLAGTTVSIMTGQTRTLSALADMDVRTQTKAQKLIKIADTALTSLRQASSDIAGFLNRLDRRVNINSDLVESYTNARDSAESADIALETANLARMQVLQQAQVAAMSQANIQMQSVLALLK